GDGDDGHHPVLDRPFAFRARFPGLTPVRPVPRAGDSGVTPRRGGATIWGMTWRGPHCSTPQAEASRCWVCHRSSTSCGTCRHFRRSVAARVGYCGLDRHRQPLDGREVRACWEDGTAARAFDPPTGGLLDLLTEPML